MYLLSLAFELILDTHFSLEYIKDRQILKMSGIRNKITLHAPISVKQTWLTRYGN